MVAMGESIKVYYSPKQKVSTIGKWHATFLGRRDPAKLFASVSDLTCGRTGSSQGFIKPQRCINSRSDIIQSTPLHFLNVVKVAAEGERNLCRGGWLGGGRWEVEGGMAGRVWIPVAAEQDAKGDSARAEKWKPNHDRRWHNRPFHLGSGTSFLLA
jgi:hypothetical protein